MMLRWQTDPDRFVSANGFGSLNGRGNGFSLVLSFFSRLSGQRSPCDPDSPMVLSMEPLPTSAASIDPLSEGLSGHAGIFKRETSEFVTEAARQPAVSRSVSVEACLKPARQHVIWLTELEDSNPTQPRTP